MRPAIYSNEFKENIANEINSFLADKGYSLRTAIKSIAEKHKIKTSSATYFYYKYNPTLNKTYKKRQKAKVNAFVNLGALNNHSLAVARNLKRNQR